jgi:FMN phosphatase YigB (HAD superfamily)
MGTQLTNVMGTSTNAFRKLAQSVRNVLELQVSAPPPVDFERIEAIIKLSQHRFIAFDIFDTLVTRSVNPEDVKLLAADRLIRRLAVNTISARGFYRLRRQAEVEVSRRTFDDCHDFEFRFAEVSKWLFDRLVTNAHLGTTLVEAQFCNEMLSCELAVESSVLKVINPMRAAFQVAHDIGKNVILVSDFYLPAQHLLELLKPFGIVVDCNAIFVSCDYRASKRSGRLYDILLAKLGIAPSQVLMLGDNYVSDVQQACAKGLDAVRAVDSKRRTLYKSRATTTVYRASKKAILRETMSQCRASPDPFGSAIAPALLSFVAKLYSEARRRRFRHLFFLSREGETLRRLFETFQNSLGLSGDDRIQTHYLLVSRRSTYVASLNALEEERFEDLALFYPHMSFSDFLRSLSFTDFEIQAFSTELGITTRTPLGFSQEDPIVARLRQSSGFRRAYEARRLSTRSHLLAHIRQFEVSYDDHPLVLVDVGWKGSIQDFLRAALPTEIAIMGLYFGHIDVGQQRENKFGLMLRNTPTPTRYYRTYNENRTVFELVLCADHGSVVGYDARPDGKVDVVLEQWTDERDQTPGALWRQAVLERFQELCTMRNRFVIEASEWDKFAASQFARLVFRPWVREAQALATARHHENFGVFFTRQCASNEHPTFRQRWNFCVSLLRSPKVALSATHWPAYSIYRHTNLIGACAYRGWRHLQDWRRAALGETSPGATP